MHLTSPASHLFLLITLSIITGGASGSESQVPTAMSVQATAHGARIACPLQDIEGWLTQRGLEVRSVEDGEPGSVHMRAVVLGRDDSSISLQDGEVLVSEGIARLVRPGVIEEVTTSGDGIRQDWVVTERPSGRGPLSLGVSISGATISGLQDQRLDLRLEGGRAMTWHALRVFDAGGITLPARFSRRDDMVAIVVDDHEARYPIRIDPTFTDSDWFTVGQYPGTVGAVRAMIPFAGDLIVAGEFSMAGSVPGTGHIACWNGTTWSALGGGTNGTVNALTTDGTSLYAGGSFTLAGGTAVNNVAQWNGATWSAVGSAGSDPVTALAMLGTTLCAAGRFPHESGWLKRVVSWNGSTWVPIGTGLYADGLIGNGPSFSDISCLTAIGSKLYAGGTSSTGGGTVVEWDGAEWSHMAGGLTGFVYTCVAIGSDLYIGGFQMSCQDLPDATNFFRWDGTSWSSPGNGFSYPVYAIGMHDGTIYASGVERVGAYDIAHVKKWNGTVWDDAANESIRGTIRCIGSFGNALHIGGAIGSTGDSPDVDEARLAGIARFDSGTWAVLGNGVMGKVQALAALGDDLYVGGTISAAGGQRIHHLVRWNGSDWSAVGTGLSGYWVTALHVMDNKLYVGGTFDTAGGVATNGVACWDGVTWSTVGTGTFPGMITTLTGEGNELFAGGHIGSPEGFVCRASGGVWTQLGTNATGPVLSLAMYGGKVHAAGRFGFIGGVAAQYVARWEGSTWSRLVPQLTSAPVSALEVLNGRLYAAGAFSIIGGVSAKRVASWNGTTWAAVGSGLNSSVYEVHDLLARGSDLYVSGIFTQAGDVPANGLACWNGTAWSALGTGSGGLCLGATTTDLFVGDDYGVRRAHLTAPPTIPVDSDAVANQVAENAAIGSGTGLTINASDPEGAPLGFSLVTDAGGRFAIHPTTGVVTLAGTVNYEAATSHAITVRASDGINTVTQAFVIAVTNVDEPPTTPVDVDAAANEVIEEASIGSVVGLTASATDPEGLAISYDLTDSAGGRFAIHATTGVVTLVGALDYETTASHVITVRASDNINTITQTFTITITDANEPPTTPVDIDAAANEVIEGAPLGSVVGLTASASDPEGLAITYDLTDSAGGRFAIDPITGVVTLAGGVSHAASVSHAITVRATVSGQTTSTVFVIAVKAPTGGGGPSSGGGGGSGGCGLGGLIAALALMALGLRRWTQPL